MQTGKHVAQKYAEHILKYFPETVKAMTRYQRLAILADGCFISSAKLFEDALHHDGIDIMMHLHQMSALHNAMSWRFSPSIYRFDPALFQAVTQTALDNIIRAEAFQQLPSWGLFIETPSIAGLQSEGFFVSLSDDREVPGYGEELRLTFVLSKDGKKTFTIPVPIVDGTVEDCMQALEASTMKVDPTFTGIGLDNNTAFMQNIAQAISLVLYLCTEEPDTPAPRARQIPERNKKGEILLPAMSPNIWPVGLRFAAANRVYQQAQATEEGRGNGGRKRPHLRRAHWHGYWYGAKQGQKAQTFKLRWLPPVIVGGDPDDLPAILHRIDPNPH